MWREIVSSHSGFYKALIDRIGGKYKGPIQATKLVISLLPSEEGDKFVRVSAAFMDKDNQTLVELCSESLVLAILASGAPPAPGWFEPRMRPKPEDRWEVDGKPVRTGEVTFSISVSEGTRPIPRAAINVAQKDLDLWFKERDIELARQWPASYAKMVLGELGRGEDQ
jgi:hypothetical protein